MYNAKYPRCWPRVSKLIRCLADGRCEWCQERRCALSVHHLGAPYANGKPGDPRDKHDIRRENLVALCWSCHRRADTPTVEWCKERKAQRELHRCLGIGTGLIVRGNNHVVPEIQAA